MNTSIVALRTETTRLIIPPPSYWVTQARKLTLLRTQQRLRLTPHLIALYRLPRRLTLLLAVPQVVSLVTFGLRTRCRLIRPTVRAIPLLMPCRPRGLRLAGMRLPIQALELCCALRMPWEIRSPMVLCIASWFILNTLVSPNLPGSPLFVPRGSPATHLHSRLLIRLVSRAPPTLENDVTVPLLPTPYGLVI